VWLRADTWPTPKWYRPPGDTPLFGWLASRAKLKRYEDYLTHQFRARYMELEGDFRTVYANFGNTNTVDQGTAARIVDLLHLSREVLERDAPDLAAASAALDLVERYMVWTYPLHVAEARITTMYLRVETLPPRDRAAFTRQLDLVCDSNGKLKPGVGYGLRAVFEGRDLGPHCDAVVLNAALALEVTGVVPSPEAGVVAAIEAIRGGDAARLLERLAAFGRRPRED